MISILIGIVLIILAMMGFAIYRGLQLKHLVNKGVSAIGQVEKLWHHTGATGTSKYRLRYRFTAADGQQYTRGILISSGERDQFQEGSDVEIIYLPNNPRVNALATLVAQAKSALKS